MTDHIQERWRDFDALGELEVRQRLAAHVYGEDNERLAREWLEHGAQSRADEAERRSDASSSEQIRIARSAKNAAWAAAIAAIIAAICAAIAIIVSFWK